MDQFLSEEWLSDAGLDPSLYYPLFQRAGGVRLKALVELWQESSLDEALLALGVTTLGARRCLSLAVERCARQYLGSVTSQVSPPTTAGLCVAGTGLSPASGLVGFRLGTEKHTWNEVVSNTRVDYVKARASPVSIEGNTSTIARSWEADLRGARRLEAPMVVSHAKQQATSSRRIPNTAARQYTVGVQRKRPRPNASPKTLNSGGSRQGTLLDWGITRHASQPTSDYCFDAATNCLEHSKACSAITTLSKPLPAEDCNGEQFKQPADMGVLEAFRLQGFPKKSSVVKPQSQGGSARARHPACKLIAGASGCVVDSFRVPMRADDGYRHFFLTHYHADHYGGLRKTQFRPECKRRLYASPITSSILQAEYRLDDTVLVRVPVGDPKGIIVYEDPDANEPKPLVRVMACDANHCPGAVIFVFQVFSTGKIVVHCGDMRYEPSRMRNDPILSTIAASQHEVRARVHRLHVDTTYSDPRYDFAPQEVVLEALRDAAQREAAYAPTLFLCGTYFIGKERVWVSLAQALGTKVFIDPSWHRKRRVLLDCMCSAPGGASPYAALLSERVQDSCVHLVHMADVQPRQLLRAFRRAQQLGYRQLVGVMATGWCHPSRPDTGTRRLDGLPVEKQALLERSVLPNNRSCVLYKLPYSEHSSFTELKAFIDWIQPERIVPTVSTRAAHLQRLLPKRVQCTDE
ncbi:hypothetical protein CCYA_CCYA01G0122 [Cyanidiococcus yangmingshanensis]|nr:hypothetical protein CCYA_CCYA01G0122 [Cyanidiococcus yangmingshanensis]